jgi:hypothetical protein
MSDERDLAHARAEAAEARERLLGTAQVVQARLKPAALANDAWDTVRDKSEVVAEGAVRAVAKRPAVASVAVLGLAALVARKPIARLFARFSKN